MSQDVEFTKRLPIYNNEDGDQIADAHGNVYEYNAERQEWIFLGQVACPDIVTEQERGLVSPSIQRKLEHLQRLIDEGADFNLFKLFTDVDPNPYYYLFQSADGLIKFQPEVIKTSLVLLLQDFVQSFQIVSGSTIISTSRNNIAPGSMVGATITFITGAERRESFTIIDHNVRQVEIAGQLDLADGDIFRIFTPAEQKTNLRMEVNRDQLYRRLIGKCCVGPKGDLGEKGNSGRDGLSSPDEVFKTPGLATDDVLTIDDIVSSPIDTPISLRLFRGDTILVEFLVALDGSGAETTIFDEEIQIEETGSTIFYDQSNERLLAEIKFTAGTDDIEDWLYKARQQGPPGEDGKEGNQFFTIGQSTLGDPAIRSASALISLRKSEVDDSIFITADEMFQTVCATNLVPSSSQFPTGDIQEMSLVSVEISTRDCKDIGTFIFQPVEEKPLLILPLWTPTKDCIDPRRYFQYNFDWYACLEERYPFQIFPNPKPPEMCCADDFFFCPNLGDVCEIEGVPSAPPFFPPEAECECVDPIEFDLQGGGFLLDPLDTTGLESGEIATTSIEGVIRGCPNRFMQELTVTGTTYSVELTKSPICGTSDFVVADCPITIQVVLTGDCGIDQPIQTVTSLPSSVEFNIEATDDECEIMAEIVVNTEGVDCCQGYTMTTTLTPAIPPIPPISSFPGVPPASGSGPGDTAGSGPGDTAGSGSGTPQQPFPPEITGGGGGKEIAGEDGGEAIAETGGGVSPPISPIPPEVEEKQTAEIFTVTIDTNGNVEIVGEHFTFDGDSIVTGVLFDGMDGGDFDVQDDNTIQMVLGIPIPPGSTVTVQLLLECPPGLSNTVEATIPQSPVIPPVATCIENFDNIGTWFDVRFPLGTVIESTNQAEGAGAFEITQIIPFGLVVNGGNLSGFGAAPWDFSSVNSIDILIAKEFDPGEFGPADFFEIQFTDSGFNTKTIQIPWPATARYPAAHPLNPGDFQILNVNLALGGFANMADIINMGIAVQDFGTAIPLSAWIDCMAVGP